MMGQNSPEMVPKLPASQRPENGQGFMWCVNSLSLPSQEAEYQVTSQSFTWSNRTFLQLLRSLTWHKDTKVTQAPKHEAPIDLGLLWVQCVTKNDSDWNLTLKFLPIFTCQCYFKTFVLDWLLSLFCKAIVTNYFLKTHVLCRNWNKTHNK